MGTWIDTIVLTIITLIGLGIFYKALKEPVDMFLNLLKRALESIKERMGGSENVGYDTITYS